MYPLLILFESANFLILQVIFSLCNILFILGDANSVTILWDTIMTSMACCGVNSYLDFVVDGSAKVRSFGLKD